MIKLVSGKVLVLVVLNGGRDRRRRTELFPKKTKPAT